MQLLLGFLFTLLWSFGLCLFAVYHNNLSCHRVHNQMYHCTAQWLDHKSWLSWKAQRTDDRRVVSSHSSQSPLQINDVRFNATLPFERYCSKKKKILNIHFSLNNRHIECYCCFHWCVTCSYMLTSQKKKKKNVFWGFMTRTCVCVCVCVRAQWGHKFVLWHRCDRYYKE